MAPLLRRPLLLRELSPQLGNLGEERLNLCLNLIDALRKTQTRQNQKCGQNNRRRNHRFIYTHLLFF
jgi:hypothetical protein